MAELIAQGVRSDQRWRRRMIEGKTYVLGRGTGLWSVPWDEHISRRHAQLTFAGGALTVTKSADARNPIFFQGETRARCVLRTGQHFVIGTTTFSLVDGPLTIDAAVPLMTEHTFSAEQVRRSAFQDAGRRIDALSRLPEVIPSDISEEELCSRLVRVLLSGVPRASWAAVVAWRPDAQQGPTGSGAEVLHWDNRQEVDRQVSLSEGLIRQAVEEGCSVAHVWGNAGAEGRMDGAAALPGVRDRWAICTPLRSESSGGWCLYVAGDHEAAADSPRDAPHLQDDVKFMELVADTVGRIRALRRLERRQAAFSQFISPTVLERIIDDDPDRLFIPREAEVSVLFCDLRGFSRVSEQSAQDLMGLLERVSRALGVMTHRILEHGGVIGDFHGDAAMGFWGWPLPQPDRIERVCRAALAIRADFEQAAAQTNHPLANFRIGIGLATGRAVAGRIGTSDQVKVTVFGPVVNLAARLQELTKQLRAPILADETTAAAIREQVPHDTARVRRVARIRPRGLEVPVEMHQLLPPLAAYPELGDEHIAAYEAALEALTAGNWELAFSLLHQVPANDHVKDFLTVFIAQHHRTPPAHWDGVIDLSRGGP
jgi:adenylate cyclase